MFWRNIGLSMLLSAASAASASEPINPDPSLRWIGTLMLRSQGGQQLTLDLAERQMLLVYKTMDNSLSRASDTALQLEQNNRATRQRAQAIVRFLEKDFDNDGRVTTDELKTFLEPQSKMKLRSSTGLQVEPTAEQTEDIMQQLLATNLQADVNGDGTIDFDEMREAAATNAYTRTTNLRQADSMIIKLLDTSGDKTVSQEEFIAAVRKSFAMIDRDKDGKISPEEARPYFRGINTF